MKKDKKKKKKKKMKVKELYDDDGNRIDGEGSEDDDIDSVIQQQRGKFLQRGETSNMSGFGESQFSNLKKDMVIPNAAKTQMAFGAKAGLNQPSQAFEKQATQLTNMEKPPEKQGPPTVADNVSAGGTRYVIGIKGGLQKFYQGDGDSQSQMSRVIDDASSMMGGVSIAGRGTV